jgi:hypothetical protein
MTTRLLAVVVSGIALLSAAAIARQAGSDAGQNARPWQVDRCYRVFTEREQLYLFKVLEPPAGGWVRVQEDPAGIRVPGARPQAPLWINENEIFAVQEWSCSR